MFSYAYNKIAKLFSNNKTLSSPNKYKNVVSEMNHLFQNNMKFNIIHKNKPISHTFTFADNNNIISKPMYHTYTWALSEISLNDKYNMLISSVETSLLEMKLDDVIHNWINIINHTKNNSDITNKLIMIKSLVNSLSI